MRTVIGLALRLPLYCGRIWLFGFKITECPAREPGDVKNAHQSRFATQGTGSLFHRRFLALGLVIMASPSPSALPLVGGASPPRIEFPDLGCESSKGTQAGKRSHPQVKQFPSSIQTKIFSKSAHSPSDIAESAFFSSSVHNLPLSLPFSANLSHCCMVRR